MPVIKRNHKGQFVKGLPSPWKGHKWGKQTIETKKKKSIALKGRILSEEHKKKIGQANKISLKGRKLSDELKKRLSEIKKNNLRPKEYYQMIGRLSIEKQNQSKDYTSLEKWLYSLLENSEFEYFKQVSIGNYIVDAYIPKLGMVIEVDGKYWHNKEKNIIKDIRKDKFLNNLGYSVMRITETEAKKKVDIFTNFTILYA